MTCHRTAPNYCTYGNPGLCYDHLSVKVIWDSVERAQELNQLTALQQVKSELPTLDTMLNGWLPETTQSVSHLTLCVTSRC